VGTDVLRLLAQGCGTAFQVPAGLRQTDISYEQFAKLLKTYVFGVETAAQCDYFFKLSNLKFSYFLICLHISVV